jgi:hypothetical protein
MHSKRQIAAVTLAALMVLSVVGPALAVAQEDAGTEATDDGGQQGPSRDDGDDDEETDDA